MYSTLGLVLLSAVLLILIVMCVFLYRFTRSKLPAAPATRDSVIEEINGMMAESSPLSLFRQGTTHDVSRLQDGTYRIVVWRGGEEHIRMTTKDRAVALTFVSMLRGHVVLELP